MKKNGNDFGNSVQYKCMLHFINIRWAGQGHGTGVKVERAVFWEMCGGVGKVS